MTHLMSALTALSIPIVVVNTVVSIALPDPPMPGLTFRPELILRAVYFTSPMQ